MVAKLWGGSDIKIVNKDDVKEALNTIYEIAQNIYNDMKSGLKNSLMEATNYSEFYNHFKQSVGQALKNALIDSLLQQQQIKNVVNKLSKELILATQDARVTEAEMERLSNTYNQVAEQLRSAYDAISAMENTDFFESINAEQNVDNSFSAGTTTNITYHQQYIVEAGAMMGDEEDAEQFARYLAPYIREAIERETGS